MTSANAARGGSTDKIQEIHDRRYFQNGPCCSGCDWWRSLNSWVGECTKSAPVPASKRWGMVGISGVSEGEPGHIVTDGAHHCGDFKDEFDWSSLPPAYLRRVGFIKARPATKEES